MSTLVLVRHGQAGAVGAQSGELTATGEEQARRLGSHWVRHNVSFDEVYHGSLARQRQTAELVAETYRGAGRPWPAAQLVADLDEYDAAEVLKELAPKLAARDARFRGLYEEWERFALSPDANRTFQRMFEPLMERWLDGSLSAPQVEPWPAFRDRVRGAVRRITKQVGSGRRVAAFTSGGPIGVAVQKALAAPDRTALELNWRVRNTSLTEFLFTKDRFSLDSFNVLTHLEEPVLWTFR